MSFTMEKVDETEMTDEERARSAATKERQRKPSMKGQILKKSKDSYMLIPQKKTSITLDDLINFLKNTWQSPRVKQHGSLFITLSFLGVDLRKVPPSDTWRKS